MEYYQIAMSYAFLLNLKIPNSVQRQGCGSKTARVRGIIIDLQLISEPITVAAATSVGQWVPRGGYVSYRVDTDPLGAQAGVL